ncbi:uncharacterized protein A1O9_00978 [Exophiala aquamarina CBS 119918]|uniref:Fe2OG dioxygenase domain-containing protein n=1 Tax=Exophiala aquamarina CBS 119918 TaxID=1182545 RepID=A0A072PUH5_9EURO|nr:uncharacterized protein A1O9_00978 [Exophiala aquamarina CBS 119918]KEF63003.1 hypothetical protein A1O9_00978 [Exophiala aquamarina CBS 119918]
MMFPVGSFPAGPPIETRKALLLLDFQNDFVDPDGRLPVQNVPSFISDLPSLVAEFRAKGVIIWCGTEFKHTTSSISTTTGSHAILLRQSLKDEELSEEIGEYLNNPDHTRSPTEDPLSPSSKPDVVHDREAFLAPTMTPTKYRCCIPGSWGIRYPETLATAIDQSQDLVLLKSNYSAFVDTSLLMQLRTMLITELYICGSLSNISVYATVLDAVCHGLQVTIIEDLLGFNDELCHVEAVRQMADDMGANGMDCQELRDDLAGLLGDVIREEDFPTTFQVSLPPPSRTNKSHNSAQHINDWIARLESESDTHLPTVEEGTSSKIVEDLPVPSLNSYAKSESSYQRSDSTKVEHNPPRKRSASDLNPSEHDRLLTSAQPPSPRPPPPNPVNVAEHKEQNQGTQTRKRRPSHESSAMPAHSSSETLAETRTISPGSKKDPESEIDLLKYDASGVELTQAGGGMLPKKKTKLVQDTLGPEDKIGQGDSRLYVDLLDEAEADAAFHACKKSIKWQKMFHRTGEVPRLVAVQGDILEDGSQVPIYRHPADESPVLLPFDPVVDKLRKAAESVVRHPLNHALIQWYRNSEDNISEHSDKSLDIVQGSTIVNFSLGARRTMILRTKKSKVSDEGEQAGGETIRPSQRIHLTHNSLFVLGPETNQHWLHAIRADKRLASEKDPAELAFDGARISVTLRHIGTFVNPHNNTIWGQGATAKDKSQAAQLLAGADAEKKGELMIRAFGQENHRSTDWDWNQWYGEGFDLVNFETKSA